MLRLGVTGGMGSGKSLVCRFLAVLGIPVFDSDHEAKRLMQDDEDLRRSIVSSFGREIYSEGSLQRQRLAQAVFGNADALRQLNRLVHPVVRNAFLRWCGEQRSPYVAMETALLVRAGTGTHLDRMMYVSAPRELCITRCVARNGWSRDQVIARMEHQGSPQEYAVMADFTVVNDDAQLVLPQVLGAHHEMLSAAS
jgi:dephospho-CoA kinase